MPKMVLSLAIKAFENSQIENKPESVFSEQAGGPFPKLMISGQAF